MYFWVLPVGVIQADTYSLGSSNVMDERIIELKRKANNGDVHAQTYLGYIYEVGKGVNKRMNESLQWYFMAAKSGNRYAIEALESMRNSSESF